MKKIHSLSQGWGAGWSQVFLAPCSRSQSRLKKKLEPEPLGKKIRSRSHFKKKSGAAKKFAGSQALPLAKSFSRGLKLYVMNS